MQKVDADFYILLHALTAGGWPVLLFLGDLDRVVAVAIAVLNLALFLFVAFACSSPGCSYWKGLSVIAGTMMSGCANITILYLPLVLTVIYLFCIFMVAYGAFFSESPARERFLSMVLGFNRRAR